MINAFKNKKFLPLPKSAQGLRFTGFKGLKKQAFRIKQNLTSKFRNSLAYNYKLATSISGDQLNL